MKTRGIFVTGTDTGVGKTTFSALLISRLKAARSSVRYFKPVQTGTEFDTEAVLALARLERSEILEPTFQFSEPIAPSRAAALRGQEINLNRIEADFARASRSRNDFWVVEGAGGLLVPLNAKQSLRDLVLALDLPLVIVASTRLGTINHILLTVEAARARGCRVLGFVLNGPEDPGLGDFLVESTGLPLLAVVPPLIELHARPLGEEARRIFPEASLNAIISRAGGP